MSTPNIPAKSVNAWIYLDEDDPSGTGYTSVNSAYQSLVNNKVYQCTDMLFVCFFAVVPDNKGYYTIEIGNKDSVHPDGSTTEQYLQYTIRDARAQKTGIPVMATLNYNDNNISQIFSADPTKWQTEADNFAANVKNYLVANKMNGLDIDWEGYFAISISKQQFIILFTAIRNAFNTVTSQYLYLTMCPAAIGNLDANTVNTCFDMVSLQTYGGAYPNPYIQAGINPLLLAFGVSFEQQIYNANQIYTSAEQGFNYNGENYVYNNITMWRLNSGNYEYEQSQQVLLYQLCYNVPGSSFNDGPVITAAGNTPISGLIVRSGDVLDAIQATNTGLVNGKPGVFNLLQHGGNGGRSNTISINANDPIATVSGYTGNWFGWNVVAQLTITTKSGKKYGPFGTMNNVSNQSPFNYTAPQGQSIVAFNGNVIQVPVIGGSGTTMVISSLQVTSAATQAVTAGAAVADA